MNRLQKLVPLGLFLGVLGTIFGQETPSQPAPALAPPPAVTAPATAAPPADPLVQLPGTRQITLTSRVGQREYRIFVGIPKGEAPQNGFPVIYALDGNATFGTLLEASRRAQRTLGPMVVVGIGYPTDETIDSGRRTLDFTPPTAPELLQRLPRRPDWQTGGQAEFLRFLEEDLKPVIEKMYTIDRQNQTLVGHSLGGLLVLHQLFSQPERFQHYVALSPSIWWAEMAILGEERHFTEQHGCRADVLIAVGGREKEHMVDDARDLADRLKSLSGYGLRVNYKEFADEDHGSIVATAMGTALRFSQAAGPR